MLGRSCSVARFVAEQSLENRARRAVDCARIVSDCRMEVIPLRIPSTIPARLPRTALCDRIPSSLQGRELFAPPIEMLLRFCPQRRCLLLVISVTGVISVGVDNLEPVLHQAEEFVERFHQRVMLLFACLAVGVSAAFLLELFDGRLNLRVLLLDQNAERKRAHIIDRAQQRRSQDHHRRFRLRIHGRVKQLRVEIFRPQYTASV